MIPISGTLEGTGPNKAGTTSAACRDYGYNGITANATTSPPLRGTVESNGINKSGTMGATLTSAIDGNADTMAMAVPAAGTIEDGGPNA